MISAGHSGQVTAPEGLVKATEWLLEQRTPDVAQPLLKELQRLYDSYISIKVQYKRGHGTR